MLSVRRPGCLRGAYWEGNEGSGGTSFGGEAGPELVAGRPGDWSRKVRPVIELLLAERRSVALALAERRPFGACDWVEARRSTIRFVWTFSIWVGVGVRLRRAAAAAAEERLALEGCDFRKAWLAADWADCAAGEESGWKLRRLSVSCSAATREVASQDFATDLPAESIVRLEACHIPGDEQRRFSCDVRRPLFPDLVR